MSQRNAIAMIVVAACAICMISFGLRSTMGLFLPQFSTWIDSGRADASLAIAIQNLVWGLGAPIAGMLCQRIGNVKVIVLGAMTYATGLALAPHATAPWHLHLSIGVLVGFGIACTAFGVILPALARLSSTENRGTLLGIGTAAGSAGQAILVPGTQFGLDFFSPSTMMMVMAGCALSMILLAAPLARADVGQGIESDQQNDQSAHEALREAAKMPSYWYIVLGFFVCGFQLAFMTVHFPSFLIESGRSAQEASFAIGIIGLFNIFGAYYSGRLSNRYPKRLLLFWIYSLRALSLVLFLWLPLSTTGIYVFSAVTGLLWLATVPPTSGLVAQIFGTTHMALLYGIVFLSHQVGSFTGVWLGGRVYDLTGSYAIVWWLAVGIALLSAVIHLPVKEAPLRRPAPAA